MCRNKPLILKLANALMISIEELLGETTQLNKSSKRGPAPKLQRQVEIISQLATDLLDAIIQQSYSS